MKNIETIIKELGIEITDEQKTKLNEEVKENYKPVADYNKQVDKIKSLEESVKATQEQLQKFDGVDADNLNKQIKELQDTIEKNKADYDSMIANRDFTDAVTKEIAGAKGKNTKAIMALLDLETLKNSKNQAADIKEAIKALTEAEDSKMLFGEAEPDHLGTGNPIGTVRKDGSQGLSGVEKAFFERTGVKLD